MIYPKIQQQPWVPDRLRKRKKDENQREDRTEREGKKRDHG